LSGKHGQPSTGDGKTGSGKKIGKAEVKVQRPSGSWMAKATAALWGKGSKKK
jgi:hypothetical protein